MRRLLSNVMKKKSWKVVIQPQVKLLSYEITPKDDMYESKCLPERVDDINVLQRQLMSNDYPHWRDENYDDLWLLRDNKRSYVAHAEGDDAEQAEADSEDEGEQSEIEETNEEPEESPPAEDETVNEETEAAPLEYTDYDASKTEKSGNDEYEEVDMASSQNIVCNSTVLLNIIFSISLHLIITQGW